MHAFFVSSFGYVLNFFKRRTLDTYLPIRNFLNKSPPGYLIVHLCFFDDEQGHASVAGEPKQTPQAATEWRLPVNKPHQNMYSRYFLTRTLPSRYISTHHLRPLQDIGLG